MATIQVDVVSAEENIFSGEAKFVALPGESGELGILPRHTPLITRIKAGAVRIQRADNGEEAHFSSYPIALTPQMGIVARAEFALVADSTCPLFGGTVAADVVLTDLEAAKQRKMLEIALSKNVEMYAPKTTSLGVFDSTDADNNKLSIVIQVTQLAEAKGLPAVAGFKDSNGTWLTLTLDQLGQIALEMTAQVLPLYEKEAVKFAEIAAAADIATVEAVLW